MRKQSKQNFKSFIKIWWAQRLIVPLKFFPIIHRFLPQRRTKFFGSNLLEMIWGWFGVGFKLVKSFNEVLLDWGLRIGEIGEIVKTFLYLLKMFCISFGKLKALFEDVNFCMFLFCVFVLGNEFAFTVRKKIHQRKNYLKQSKESIN